MINGILSDIRKVGNAYVVVDLIPVSNRTSRPQTFMTPKFITIHNTGNSRKGANAESNSRYVDTTTAYVSWHFTVDDKYIFQELPVNERGYHAGDGSGDGNARSIGIEICENIDGDYDKAEANAVALVHYLMKEMNIKKENVFPHQHWSGKWCPHKILERKGGWSSFMIKIQPKLTYEQIINKISSEPTAWLKYVKASKELANNDSNFGEMEIGRFLDILIEKAYEAGKIDGATNT